VTRLLAITLAASALALAPAIARADKPEGCGGDDSGGSEKKQGKFHIEYIGGKPVTVIDTVVAVCGKVPKPSVVYVLIRKDIDYEWESLKQDFMPLILNSVQKAPF